MASSFIAAARNEDLGGWLLNSTRADPSVPVEDSAKKGLPRTILAYIVNLSGEVEESSTMASYNQLPRMMVLKARFCLSKGISSVYSGSYVVKSHDVRTLASVRMIESGAPGVS